MTEKWPFDLIDVCCGERSRHCPIKLHEVYCDGYFKQMKVGAISHFHSDHIGAIEDCLRQYDEIITHKTTLKALGGIDSGWPRCENWVPLEYGDTHPTNSSEISLLKANHIPGSAQVHVVTDGKSLLYSGDFSYPHCTIRQADYLVLDATHGDPSVDGKTDRKSVLSRMYEDVKEKLDDKKTVVIYSDTGTIQEIIRHFEIGYDGNEAKLSHDIEFVAKENQIKILEAIYNKEKDEFRKILKYGERDFWRILRNNEPCVIFLVDRIRIEDLTNYYTIFTGRYQFRQSDPPIIYHDDTNSCHYNLASHASIDNVLKYVADVKPKVVVTDGSRSDQASTLARQIELKFDHNIQVFPRGDKPQETRQYNL